MQRCERILWKILLDVGQGDIDCCKGQAPFPLTPIHTKCHRKGFHGDIFLFEQILNFSEYARLHKQASKLTETHLWARRSHRQRLPIPLHKFSIFTVIFSVGGIPLPMIGISQLWTSSQVKMNEFLWACLVSNQLLTVPAALTLLREEVCLFSCVSVHL